MVPLFETVADLRSAGETIRTLLLVPSYREELFEAHGRQEVMIGYSDSAKDGGRFAAAWELYQAQEQIVSAAKSQGVPLTIFHGRGGTVGRGGGPTVLAIQSQPPGSVDGTLRVTEQGEMIDAKFGLPGIALRTLEIYMTATLEATVAPASPPKPEWRELMTELSELAHRSYRNLVYEDAQFVDYLQAATPIGELEALLKIGSRPARRRPSAGLGSLRAILGFSPGPRTACFCQRGWESERLSSRRWRTDAKRSSSECTETGRFFGPRSISWNCAGQG